MRIASSAVLVLAILAATSCGGSTTPAGPSAVTTPPDVTMTLSGLVRDGQDNSPVAGAMVQIANGPDIEKFATTDAGGNFSLGGLKVGAFVVVFSRNGFLPLQRTVSAMADTRVEVQLTRGTPCTVPPVPQNFEVLVRPNTNEVTFRWNAVPGAEEYSLGVGNTRGSSNRRRTNTTQLEYVWRGHPAGDFFSRVAARNSCGGGNSSNEVTYHVGQPPQ